MIQRLTALLIAVAALLAFSAPAALAQPAQPTPTGDVPTGFPADLKKFVGGTPEFTDGPWFHDPDCVNKGGNVGMYINAVMKDEPRLLYWSAPPEARALMWGGSGLSAIGDPNKEPPVLPRTFPASSTDRDAYHLSESYCADELRSWASPADNAWGFTWAPVPDPDSLEAMKPYANNADDPEDLVHRMANPCEKAGSPFCQKAFFVDCGKVVSTPAILTDCVTWNTGVANLYAGMARYIEQNTSWFDKIGQFFGVVGDAVIAGGKAIVDAFGGILNVSVAIAKFVINPAGAVDDLANALHQSATDLTTKVLQGLASVSTFDPSAPWFLQSYAASSGIGIAVMAILAVLMIVRTARGGGGREELQESLFKNLPLGLFLAIFAPGIATFLGQITNSLTDGIVTWQAGSLNSAVAKLALIGTITVTAVPGAAIVGIIIFLLLIIGAFSIFIGLAMQSVALPFAGFAAGVAWGMWVHPKQKPKALRVPMTYIGVLLAKPATFLLIGFGFKAIDGNASIPALKSGGIPLLTQMVYIIVILLIMGLAPFSLMKYFPLLPTSSDSLDSEPSSGFGTSSTVGAGVGAVADRHRAKESTAREGNPGQRQIAQSYNSGTQTPGKPPVSEPPPSSAGARLNQPRPQAKATSPVSRGGAEAASKSTGTTASNRLLGLGTEPGKNANLPSGAAEASRVSAAPGAQPGSAATRLHGPTPPVNLQSGVMRGAPAAAKFAQESAPAAASAGTTGGGAAAGFVGAGAKAGAGFTGAAAGTTGSAGALGSIAGMAGGPWAVAATAGVAAFNKVRAGVHHHGAQVDVDPAKSNGGDD